MQKICADFHELILKNFTFLFDRWGFEIVTEEVSRFGDRCLIILQSSQMKIKFYQAPDEVNILLGTLSSPSTWDNSQYGEKVWHYIRGVIRYLNNDLTPIRSNTEKWSDRTIDRQMAELSDMLKQNIAEIDALFQNENFEAKRNDYLQFLDKLITK